MITLDKIRVFTNLPVASVNKGKNYKFYVLVVWPLTGWNRSRIA